MHTKVQDWARTLRNDVATLFLAARDPRVPWSAKALAALIVAYALSPIDLIPDFIPVLGLIDDIIIVPLGVLLVVKLIPKPVIAELRARAEAQADEPRASWAGALIVLLIWVLLALVLLAVFLPDPRAPTPQPGAA